MSDPAMEAARRAWIKPRGRWALSHFDPNNRLEQSLADAAREGLKPIREMHKPMELRRPVFNGDGTLIGQRVHATVCEHCYGGPRESVHCDPCEDETCEGSFGPVLGYAWPCATARLVYSADELSTDEATR